MDVSGYVRVSTAEQADSGAGLEAQRRAVRAACRARAWSLGAIFEDAGVSGRGLNRPGLEAALGSVEGGGSKALVIAKVDRLSRSLGDFVSLMERSRLKGWAIVALDIGVDTTTPQGEMVANMMATFAQFERRLIGQRTKDALAVKRQEGVQLGRPRILGTKVVRRIERLRSAGYSYREIADALNESGTATAHGGKAWYPATVRKIVMR
ncbi:MAG: hypothetical protein QOI95_4435 [Acidimicrobiaceae bacterium]|jgi:DNA invertase Pin-like site-specific DNA recombinase